MNKYRNKPTVVDGIRFDSAKESRRYAELKLLERAGVITGLKTQVPFVFELNGERIGKYVADFCYVENKRKIVEDCKGYRTREYLLKKRLMKAFYLTEILET